ncbi:MAG: hypothetical protein M3Q23_02220 [Actinomycetota bacterium]|nr:hypothetical protein [Actinomycetota bacterium]
MTVVLGAVGGLAALLRPGRLWALAIADALVATAVVASMFGVGLYELAPLMLLGAATIRTPHRPAATSAPVALGEATPEPQRRTA